MKRVLLLALVACGSKPKPPITIADPVAATCDKRECLAAFEGKTIAVLGTFVFPTDPTRKGPHLYKLVLSDDTTVILPRDAKLTKALDGKPITVRGVHYKHPIPDRYGIIQATAEPYLVELRAVIAN